jgi:hypothetical protein
MRGERRQVSNREGIQYLSRKMAAVARSTDVIRDSRIVAELKAVSTPPKGGHAGLTT